jgi:N-acetylglucosaminyldiphosphoundecaprenol N-acetyl-beta-D-mannosaminyltransferase
MERLGQGMLNTSAPDNLRAHVLGLPVDLVDMPTAVAKIVAGIQAGGFGRVSTLDSQGAYLAQHNGDLRVHYEQSSLVTADSYGVVWALSRKGHKQPRVTGVDLVDALCAAAAEHGLSVYFLGAAPGMAQEAANRLAERHSGLRVSGVRDGYFRPDERDEVARHIADSKTDMLFVAMGIPRQELFITEYWTRLNVGMAVGVGGSLDVLSGRVKRAPKLIQAMRVEWLWRLILNPRKLPKVMALPKFAWRVLWDKS